MIQSPPTHTGSSILLKGFPFFYVRWGVRQSGTYLERGAPAPAADTVTMLTSSYHCCGGKVACFSSPRLPAHVIREEKAASGSSLSRATGRRTTTASCSRPAASFSFLILSHPRLKKKLLNQRRAKSAAGEESGSGSNS